VEVDQAGDESSHSVSSLANPGGVALSDSEKAEVLADNLVTQFQPVTDSLIPAVIETVNVGLRSYFMAPAGQPKLTNPEEVQEAIRGQQGSGPERYTEQGFEASPTGSIIPPGPDL
jgi:hypothetical protein